MIETQLSAGSAHRIKSAGTARPTEGCLIVDPPQPGAWNMALDEALLVDAAERGVATLRFYQWSEPTLSLGYFQRYDDRRQHAASRNCAVVRRQTGGGAILHDRELTYSITLPATHPLAWQSERLYAAVHDAFVDAIDAILPINDRQWSLLRHAQSLGASSSGEQFLCFQRRARGDVLFLPKAAGAENSWKILGSAQRRHRGAVLQHGSLLLERSPAAPELPGLFNLTGRSFEIKEYVAIAIVRIEAACGARFFPANTARELHPRAARIACGKYDSTGWTIRR
jgi:lipoyl(octanoyl) transferase